MVNCENMVNTSDAVEIVVEQVGGVATIAAINQLKRFPNMREIIVKTVGSTIYIYAIRKTLLQSIYKKDTTVYLVGETLPGGAHGTNTGQPPLPGGAQSTQLDPTQFDSMALYTDLLAKGATVMTLEYVMRKFQGGFNLMNSIIYQLGGDVAFFAYNRVVSKNNP